MKEKRHLAVGAMVAEWEAKIARLKADLAAMTSRYSRAATDIASLEDEVTASKERIQQLYSIQGEKDGAIVTLTSKLEGVTLMWEGDLRRISILERKLRESAGEISMMRREVDTNVERGQGSNPEANLEVVG